MDKAHLEDWLGNEYTQAYREKLKTQLMPAVYQRLITACRQSVDPAVRAAITQFESAEAVLGLFTKGDPEDV